MSFEPTYRYYTKEGLYRLCEFDDEEGTVFRKQLVDAIFDSREITTAFVQKLLQCDYGHATATIDWLIEKKMIEEIPDSHKYKVTFLLPAVKSGNFGKN